MEVYIEFIYLINYLVIVVSLELMAILLNKEMSMLLVLKQAFFLSGGSLLMFIDQNRYLLLLIWLIIMAVLYQRQIFLFYPVFIFVYFSLLFFLSSLVTNSFIYNGILITELDASKIVFFILCFILGIIQTMFIVFLKRKVRVGEYMYPIELNLADQNYLLEAFLDSGNEVYYQGFPLILVNQSVINDYQVIDILKLHDLRSDVIEIVKVDKALINNQILSNIYVGVIKGIQFDCLLNKSLMGGVL